MFRTRLALLAIVVAVIGPMRSVAQAASGSGASGDNPPSVAGGAESPAMTSAELLALAAERNTLVGPDAKPWHMKASFELFDDEGKSKSTGTYEEWWVSNSKSKLSFTVDGVSQTTYYTAKGLFRTGPPDWLGVQVMGIPTDLHHPMAQSSQNYTLTEHEETLGQAHLRCITLSQAIPDTVPSLRKPGTYCLDVDKPALRVAVSSDGVYKGIYNKVGLFQDHFIARDIHILREGKPYRNIQLESAESLSPVLDSDFEPPADAFRAPPLAPVSFPQTSQLIHMEGPSYPPGAKAVGIEGVVVVQAIIGKDGHLRNLSVLSGPKLLRQAALDAVEHWIYKPYIFNGKPVEVETRVNVVFSLHDHP